LRDVAPCSAESTGLIRERRAAGPQARKSPDRSQADIDNGNLIGLVGVAPSRPAEFVVIRIQQKTRKP
jgi:phage tail sheath protein FI